MTQTFGQRIPPPKLSPIERLRKVHVEAVAAAPPWLADEVAAKREAERLEALNRFDILDTPPEEAFDKITRLTRRLFGAQIAMVSLIDGHRQWYKSSEGIHAVEAPRADTFCTRMTETSEPLIVCDAPNDPRFAENPYVVGAPFIRFYAGAPLVTDDGKVIGSLCAFDSSPREPTDDQVAVLCDLAAMVMDELNLRALATRDPLTGAFSRREFRERAEREVSLAIRHHDDLSCVMLDIDHFKAVNDTYGHAAGDRVLSRVIAACREVLRGTDMIGRLGGEEFAFLFTRTDQRNAAVAAEKVRAAIEAMTVSGAQPIGVTASLGVSALNNATRDLDALLAHADEALFEAKSKGRNRVVEWAGHVAIMQEGRRRVLKGGRILFNDRNSSITCTVRSLSDEGAGIDVINTAGVPPRFDLEIMADRFLRRCHVVSQTQKHLEVEFE